jgi:hypothetical protein
VKYWGFCGVLLDFDLEALICFLWFLVEFWFCVVGWVAVEGVGFGFFGFFVFCFYGWFGFCCS